MSNIRVESTHNVAIEFELADAGDRVLAMLIDVGIWIAYLILVNIILKSFDYDKYVMWLFCVPLAFYHLIFEVMTHGQSPGKKAMKLRVIRLDGSKATLGDYITRWLFRMIDTFGPVWVFSVMEAIALIFTSFLFSAIGLLSIMKSKNKQRLGDMAAGTIVVKMKKRASLEDTILLSTEIDYQVKIHNILDLSDNDVRIIKKVLDMHSKADKSEQIAKLAKMASELLNVNYKGSDVGFLKNIIKDYNVKANQVDVES